jgi:hypothetical protein
MAARRSAPQSLRPTLRCCKGHEIEIFYSVCNAPPDLAVSPQRVRHICPFACITLRQFPSCMRRQTTACGDASFKCRRFSAALLLSSQKVREKSCSSRRLPRSRQHPRAGASNSHRILLRASGGGVTPATSGEVINGTQRIVQITFLTASLLRRNIRDLCI